MGKKENMSKYGQFIVNLDKQVYSPKDQVSGMLYLDLLEEFPSSQVTMKVQGKEKIKYQKEVEETYYCEDEQKDKTRTHYEEVTEKHKCFDHEFSIMNFNEPYVPRGQYQVPFTFILPSDIPSTFYKKWDSNGECYAKIHYTVKAKMESKIGGYDLLKNKQIFTINAAKSDIMLQKTVSWDDHIVHCCCFNQGRFKLSTFFEKDHYVPGESAYCVVEAENHSKAKCNHINGMFEQEIKISSSEGSKNNRDVLYSVKARGLHPGEVLIGSDSQKLEIPIKGTEIHSGKDAGTHNTSTHGKLIKCEYFLTIKAMMNACICCGEHPNTKIPINLSNPEIQAIPSYQ